MITLEELSDVKEKRNTNLYYEEKEYLQYIFLNAISKYSENFVFKGGTALRICYGLRRASEDLDFSTMLSINEIKKILLSCLKDFDLLNIPYEVYSQKEFKGNIRFEIRFKGPLFNGNLNSTNTLKIDFNNQRSRYSEVKVIEKTFSDVPLFVIIVLSEREILAEKIRTIINRSEPRDLYDLWFLFSKGVVIDKALIKRKLKEENSEFKNLNYPSRDEYNVYLKNLVVILPDYEQVLDVVKKNLNKIFFKS
jgi:predicted nucleotidyltransferase component of viral defense system